MANQKLLEVLLDTKQILCRNDYYIHIPKKIVRVTNTENMIPHLMGMQYIARPDMFTGDRGVYMIKKGRLKYKNIENLVKKYYKGTEKQASILAMVKLTIYTVSVRCFQLIPFCIFMILPQIPNWH